MGFNGSGKQARLNQATWIWILNVKWAGPHSLLMRSKDSKGSHGIWYTKMLTCAGAQTRRKACQVPKEGGGRNTSLSVTTATSNVTELPWPGTLYALGSVTQDIRVKSALANSRNPRDSCCPFYSSFSEASCWGLWVSIKTLHSTEDAWSPWETKLEGQWYVCPSQVHASSREYAWHPGTGDTMNEWMNV